MVASKLSSSTDSSKLLAYLCSSYKPDGGLHMVVLDENGKPCRACGSMLEFQQSMGSGMGLRSPSSVPPPTLKASTETVPGPAEVPGIGPLTEPPDSLQLGQNTWTFLHSVAAYYPPKADPTQQNDMRQLLGAVSHLYPCKSCATDFEKYISKNEPKVEGREQLGMWLCDAHNAVNTKLGKPVFDCRYWMQRWREGWDDFVKSQNQK